MAQSIDEQDLIEEQQRLRDEVQRLRDEQQRLRDEQERIRLASAGSPKPSAAPTDKAPEPPPAKKKRNPAALIILAIVIVALAVGGFFLLGYLDSYESTDDAQIDGHIDSVSSRIDGTVTGVYVDDNQQVQAGQLLAELDPRDYQIALEKAQRPSCPGQSQ
jgi:biotin carboxyl carrier protein